MKLEQRNNEMWAVEENGTEHFYMTVEDYEKSLNKPTVDETQSKLDALGEGLAYLLGVINNA